MCHFLSVSVSRSFSDSLSFHHLYQCLSISPCLYLKVPPPPKSLPLCVCQFLLFISIIRSLPVPPTFSPCLSLSFMLYLSVSLCLSLFFLSRSIFLFSHVVSSSPSHSLYLSQVFLFIRCPSIFCFLSFSLSLPRS